MTKINFTKNLNGLRKLILVVSLALGMGNAWAGGSSTTYYANLTISKSGETGKGKVYYATSNSKPSSETSGALKSAGSTTQNANQTYYWWVDVDPGYNVTVSGKITAGPASAATLSGNVACAQSSSSGSGTSYTATANIVAVTVNSATPTSKDLAPTNPSIDYPFTVTFATSNLKTIALDLDKSPETADGKFTITSWALDGTNVVATGKFNGGGSYGGASRNNSTTVSLKSKASGSAAKTCTVTANFPALAFVGVEATDVYATQGESGKTGSATFKYNYAAEDDFPTTPTLAPTSGTGTFTVTGYTVTPDFAKGKTTVTVNYSFDTNNGIGETPATLTLTAANGDVRTVTVTGNSEALATNDASVTTTANVTTEYATFAQALAAANATSGATLTLLRNVDLGTITATNNINKAMTIDLNGKELRAAVNATDVGILTIAKAVAVTIKDSKTGGKIINEIARNSAIRTIFVNKAGATLTLESGTIAVNNLGQYASAANSTLGVAKYASCTARAIHQIAGTTVNINGGRVEAYGTRSVYGIVQASTAATNKAGTSVLNITNGEIYAEAPYYAYGICAYGKVNFSNGTITSHINTNMVDARYAADAKQNTYNGYGYGIYMGASANAAAASCYYGTLEMTGGTVSVTNDRTLNGNYPNYGVYLYAVAANVSSATAVAADGKSRGQIASAKASVDGGEISVISGTQYSYGVYAMGGYNSYDNTYHTVQLKNCKITSKAYVCAYGVGAYATINTTNGAGYAGDVELTNCDVYAESLNTTTASAVWVYATSATIFKDGTTTNAATWGGEFAVAGKAVINSGKYEAKTKTTTAMAVGTSSRAKTVYDPITTVQANRIPGGNAEAYPILIIHGGTFKATSTTTTARGVSNGGYCTIDGGTFEAYATTTTAQGLYCLTGKITASGVTISASATEKAYGALADVGIPTGNTAQTGFAYAGEIELNNCDITATTRTSTEARGVFVNATNKMHTWAGLKSDSTSNKWATTTYNAYKSVFPCTVAGHDSVGIAIAAKATINGCDIKATAATTTAYGVYSTATSVPASADAAASPIVNIKNTKFTVKTNGTTTAYGMYAGGPTTIDGCDFTVQPKTTTAYGVYVYDKKTTITNTTFDVKGTTTAYGIYANAAIGSTTGWDYHGEVELCEGNDMTVAATSGDAAHVLTLIATKRNIATGKFAGNYANAASAHIIGGKYKATATGAKSYVLNLSDQQVQGDVISRPACIIEDGKFWALASGGTTGICSANGQIGHIVFKGGYYNVNTNLGKYKEEGKNINDILAGTPEYTEGYRYKVTSELSGAAVCKVYQSSTLKAEYATLEEALQYVNANTGTALTIVMVADYTLKKGDYILPAKATLVIPKELTQKSAIGTTPTRQNVNVPAPVQFLMLTFDAGVNMTVKGTIETSAVNTAANGGQAITGAPTGPYGRLHMVEGSTMTLESGANLNCWGYTTGKGEINALNGSTVREGFQLGFWRGGSATSDMLSNKSKWHAFPVTDYFIQNVEAPITFRPGATLYGYSGVNVSILGIQEADNVKLVGTSSSMFLMEAADASEDTYVRKEYDPATDRSIWTVNSGAKIGSFSFSLAGQTVNSADYYLPISNNMTINVNEGEFTVTQDVLQIPGSIINISKLGKLTVSSGKRLFVMDNEDWPGFQNTSGVTTRWYYNATYSPSWTTNPRTTAYPPTTTRLPDAEIFVQGETEGSYFTSTSGANIHSTNDDAGKVKFVAAAGADNSIQHIVNTNCDLVTINFTTAQLKNETPETPYTSSKNTVAGEAFVYMEQQWVKVKDGCLTTRTDGSGAHEYAKPSDVVEVVSNGDNAYRDVATGNRYFINAEKSLSNAQCVWWEVEPVTSGTYAGDYMANQEKYDNYGAYYYWDGSAGYWKPRYVTVTWKNQDGSTLATYTNVMCNTSPKYLSASPTWANTAVEKHDWVGWRDADGNIYDKNAVLPVAQGNVTYTAYYNVSKYEYTIKFVNPDKTVIWAGLVEAGTIPECPVEPTQAPTVSTVYTFTGWNTTPVEVTGPATYTAVYSETTRQYHVTFYNYDAATVLYEADVDYNTRPVYGGVTPFRANTSAYSYEWTGWQQGATLHGKTDNLAIVTGDVYYVATFSQTDLKYQVFFKRQDGSIIDAPFFNYGETPTDFPANPTLASTVSTNYTFDHWTPATLQPVTVDGMVYTAYFSESPRQYTAHFVNYDGTSLGVDQTIDYNTAPTYAGTTPFHPNDNRNSYEFAGWAWESGTNWEAGSIGIGEAFPAIKGDITFTAQYNKTLLQFNVIYKRSDGTVIEQQKKKWGESTAFPSVSSYQDDMYVYTFDHWNPATVVTPVTTDATYTAYFNQAVKTYSISGIAATPAGYGSVSPTSVTDIPNGSDVSVDGNKITVNGQTITASPTAQTAQYTYAFSKWNNVPAKVTGNISDIEAVFTRTVNTYTIIWKNGNVTLETDENVEFGATPTYNSAEPTKAATAEWTYTFNGWSPAIESVSGDATYTATFSATKNSYEITWLNDDNSLIDKTTVEYGVVPTHTDATKANTAEYTYTFTGWDNTPVAVTGTATYKATFSATKNAYEITWLNDDNSLIDKTTVEYGVVPTHADASKANTAEYTYTFTGWDNTPVAVTGTATYKATFSATKNSYTVTWKNGDATLETDENVEYGTTPTYDGDDPMKATDATYGYTFDGWSATNGGDLITEIPAVSGNTTYYAHYSAMPTVASVKVSSTTTYYATIDAAFAYVNLQTVNTELKLLQNAIAADSLVYTPAAAITCTLDLNNHTLSGAMTKLMVIKLAGSTFVVTDNSDEKGGVISNNHNANARVYTVFHRAGTLKMQGGRIFAKNPYKYSSGKSCAASGVYIASGATFTMDNGTVESESQYASYAIYMARGTSTVTINNGFIKGYTTASTTAAGIYNLGKGLTVNGGHIVGHAYTTTAYGIYLYGGHGTINGGTIEATNDTTSNKGTTTAYGIYVNYYNGTYKGVLKIPSTSTVNVFAKARTTTAYAIVVGANSTGSTIAGGTFTAKTKTSKTAYCVNSSGNITISGGTFTANAATTNAYGIYAPRGTVTVNGNPTFNVTAGTTTAYGALAYGTIGKKGTGKYSGTIKINGGTFNVTSTTTDAYGALAALASRDLRSCNATNDTVPGLHYMPGILEITDGTFNVKATTTTAYGVHVAKAKSESGDVGTTARIPKGTITGGKFRVESMDDANATAYAMNTATTAARLIVEGGWYNTKRTNDSEIPNIEDKYTAPTKSCNYRVLDLPDSELPYKYKVAEAYLVTFKDGDDNTIQSGYVEKGQTPTYTGATPTKTATAEYTYTFTGWDNTPVAVTGTATYKATFSATKNNCTVTFDMQGHGSAIDAQTITYGAKVTEPATPMAEGYTFVCWYKDKEYEHAWDFDLDVVEGNITLYAKWSINKYIITWVDMARTPQVIMKEPVQHGIVPTCPYQKPEDERYTYTMLGWTVEGAETNDPIEIPAATENATYIALYRAVAKNIHLVIDYDETVNMSVEFTTTTVKVAGKLTIQPDVVLKTGVLNLEGTPTTSGEIMDQGTVDAAEAYFNYTREGGFKAGKWYMVAVPWQVEVPAGANGGVSAKGKTGNFVPQRLDATFDLIYYNGARRATHGRSRENWSYLADDDPSQQIMQPGCAYMIALYADADTIRFKKKDGTNLHTNTLSVYKHEAARGQDAGWNGIANPATFYTTIDVGAKDYVANMPNYGQVYDTENERYELYNMEAPMVVGRPVFVQVPADKTIDVTPGTNPIVARRVSEKAHDASLYEIAIAPNQADETDRVILLMDENKQKDAYMVCQDLMKLGESQIVPQMWVNRYDSRLCVNTAIPTDDAVDYPLGIYAPEDGEYDIYIASQPEDGTVIYLTIDGVAVWNLCYRGFTAQLEQGTTTLFGLRIVRKAQQDAMGIEDATILNGDAIRKVLIDNKVYIIRNNTMYSIDGQMVK